MTAKVRACLACRRGFLPWGIAGTILVTMAAYLAALLYPVWPGDEALLAAVQSRSNPTLTGVFAAITLLGWYPVAVSVSLAVGGCLLWRKQTADALLFGAAVASALLTLLLKVVIGRPRPDFALVEPAQTMGFPSGHAAFAFLLGSALMYLAWQRVDNPLLRWTLCAALTLLALAVGLSRVYLGLHWPSDVLGGYLFGATVFPLLVILKDRLVRRRFRPPG